jgi:hypothetical protein
VGSGSSAALALRHLVIVADAAEHILACCESPGQNVGDCRWEPVPAE